MPPGSDDVTGMERRGRQAACGRLVLRQLGDRRLGDAVLAERRVSRIRPSAIGSLRLAIAPDRSAVQQVSGAAAQRIDERLRRCKREADQIDDDVGLQRQHRVAEDPVGILPFTIGDDLMHLAPLRCLDVAAARPG